MIEVINRELLIPREEYNIGTCYDDNTETRHFHLKRVTSGGVDLAALTFNLDIQYADGNTDAASLVKEVTDKDINLVLTINNSMLQVPGTVLIQIRALDEDGVCKWTSYKSAFFVEDHINTPGHYEGDLTQLEQYEAEWGKVRDNVNQLNSRMDQIASMKEGYPGDPGLAAEVLDARVGYEGTHYNSLGTAIRTQVETLQDNIDDEATARASAVSAEATARAEAVTAEAAARQSADTTLQGNIDAEASARTSADNLLDTRIDQIVSPSGEAPSAAEVTDARIGEDGTTYTSLGTAIRTQVGDLKSQVADLESQILITGLGKIPLIEMTQGYYLDGDGELQPLNSFCVTPFVELPEGYKYISIFIASTQGGKYTSWYDSAKTWVDSFKLSAGENVIEVPEGVKYIRVSVKKTEVTQFYISGYGRLNIDLIKDTRAITDYIFSKSGEDYTLFENDSLIQGGYVKNSTGSWTSSSTYYSTPSTGTPIPENANSVRIIRYTQSTDVNAISFYSSQAPSNHTYISGYYPGSNIKPEDNIEIPIPATAQSMIISGRKTGELFFCFYQENTIIESKWKNKKAIFLGDSITLGHLRDNEYVDTPFNSYACKKLGIEVLENYGISGGKLVSVKSLLNTIDASADVVIVAYGTNDWSHETPLGQFGDTAWDTFHGALRQTMTSLMTRYSGKYIFFSTPIHRGTNSYAVNDIDLTLKAYRDAIIEEALFLGIPVVDMYGDSLLNPQFNPQLFIDNTHPYQEGHNKMGEVLTARMLEIIT